MERRSVPLRLPSVEEAQVGNTHVEGRLSIPRHECPPADPAPVPECEVSSPRGSRQRRTGHEVCRQHDAVDDHQIETEPCSDGDISVVEDDRRRTGTDLEKCGLCPALFLDRGEALFVVVDPIHGQVGLLGEGCGRSRHPLERGRGGRNRPDHLREQVFQIRDLVAEDHVGRLARLLLAEITGRLARLLHLGALAPSLAVLHPVVATPREVLLARLLVQGPHRRSRGSRRLRERNQREKGQSEQTHQQLTHTSSLSGLLDARGFDFVDALTTEYSDGRLVGDRQRKLPFGHESSIVTRLLDGHSHLGRNTALDGPLDVSSQVTASSRGRALADVLPSQSTPYGNRRKLRRLRLVCLGLLVLANRRRRGCLHLLRIALLLVLSDDRVEERDLPSDLRDTRRVSLHTRASLRPIEIGQPIACVADLIGLESLRTLVRAAWHDLELELLATNQVGN